MGLFFGAGSMLLALLFLLRLAPRLIGLAVWMGSAGFSAAAALGVLYLLRHGSP